MKKIVNLITVSMLALMLVACGSTEETAGTTAQGTTTDQTQTQTNNNENNETDVEENADVNDTDKEILTVGTASGYPPYEFYQTIDGKEVVCGFDMVLAEKIAEKAGMQLEVVDMPFSSLLLALDTDKIDFVLAGMAYAADRAEKYDLSTPYFDVTQVVLTMKDDVDTYNSVESMEGFSVGVQLGTIQERIAQESMAECEIVSMDKVPSLMLDLKAGKIQGIVLEKPVAEIYAMTNDDLAISFDIDDVTPGTKISAVQQGNSELLAIINETIEELTASGELEVMMAEAIALATADATAE